MEIPLLTLLRLFIWAMLDDSRPMSTSARSKRHIFKEIIGMYTKLFSNQALSGQLTLNTYEVYLL